MKTSLDMFRLRPSFRFWFLFAALAAGLPAARAGVTVDLHLYNNNNFYFVFAYLSANNATPPGGLPVGTYTISTPQSAAAGSAPQYHSDGTNVTYITGGGNSTSDFATLMQSITNGNWTLVVTNAASTNTYTFTVSAPVLPAGLLPETVITFPPPGSSNVANQPNFTWQGPSAWTGALTVSDFTNDASGTGYYVVTAALPPAQTFWVPPIALPNGTNTFGVSYTSNATALVVASTPVDGSSQPIPGWVSTATLETYNGSQFSIGGGSSGTGPGSQGHTLVAHYTFDHGDVSGTDSSGNGNNFNGNASSWGSGLFQSSSTDAVAGGGAMQFYGYSSLAAYYTDPGTLYSNLVSTLAGSFSVSLWLNTASLMGNDGDDARNGAIVIYVFNADSQADGVIPVAITGNKLAFYTGDAAGQGSTLHSVASVVNNNDTYVHVVVTRNQTTGQKLIYINGAQDASETGSLDYLNGDTNYFSIGGVLGDSYTGLLDDLQFYSGVLSGQEVAYLFQNPGLTVGNDSASGLVAYYDFDEGVATTADVSGNGNNLVLAGSFGGGAGPAISTDSVAGAGSVSFDGGSFLSAPVNLLPVMASNFSISLWVNTSQDMGSPGNGFLGGGAGIVAADVPGLAYDVVPVGLSGGVIVFHTGGTGDDELYSATSVNDTSWHHVVVTRDQSSGAKQIFIDGSLDVSDTAVTGLLNAPQLLVLGCVTDSSNPDPASPAQHGYDGYVGLLDDLQVYNRVLRQDEVTFLDSNPGQALTNAAFLGSYSPVSVDLTLAITREEDPIYGEYYYLFPSFGVATPPLLTTNSVSSTHGLFNSSQWLSGGGSGSVEMGTLDDVISECTNGQWQLYINQGDPSQQLFTFTISISGLTTNTLPPATILSPSSGAVNVATTPAFSWAGPANFSSVVVNVFVPGGTNEGNMTLPGTATTWPSPPTLNYGTNRFEVTFNTNDLPQATFATPTNQVGTPMATFTTHLNLSSLTYSLFLVGAPLAPVQLIQAQAAGGANQFQFLSQTGVINTVQSSTNLVSGGWKPRGDILGDGTLKTVNIPATNGPVEFYRILSHY